MSNTKKVLEFRSVVFSKGTYGHPTKSLKVFIETSKWTRPALILGSKLSGWQTYHLSASEMKEFAAFFIETADSILSDPSLRNH